MQLVVFGVILISGVLLFALWPDWNLIAVGLAYALILTGAIGLLVVAIRRT